MVAALVRPEPATESAGPGHRRLRLVLTGGALLAGVDLGHPHLGRGEWGDARGFRWCSPPRSSGWSDRNLGGNASLRFQPGHVGSLSLCLLPVAVPLRSSSGSCGGLFLPPGRRVAGFCAGGPHALFSFMLAEPLAARSAATEAGLLYSTEPVFCFHGGVVSPGHHFAMVRHRLPNERVAWNLIVGGGLSWPPTCGLRLGPIPKIPAATRWPADACSGCVVGSGFQRAGDRDLAGVRHRQYPIQA